MAPILPEQVPVEVLLHAPCDIVQFARMQLDLEPGIDPLKTICVHITKLQVRALRAAASTRPCAWGRAVWEVRQFVRRRRAQTIDSRHAR